MVFSLWCRTFGIVLLLLALPACGMPKLFRRDVQKPVVPPPSIPEIHTLSPGERFPKIEPAASPPAPPEVAIEPPTAKTTVVASSQEPNQLPYVSILQPRGASPRPDGPLVLAMRAHLDNQYATAVAHLSTYERPNQELLLLLIPLLDSARTAELSGRDPKSAAQFARQLENITDLVHRAAPLEIKTMAFVHKVIQYGVYEPLPPGCRLMPGGIGLLYAEIDRAIVAPAVQSNGETGFVTRLSGSLQLTDANGQVVDLYDVEKGKMVPELPFARADFTRSSVRDFFLKIEFPIPEKPGRYFLKLEVRDPSQADHQRRTRKVVEFVVSE